MTWKPIAGYEGHYLISNTGLVRSIKTYNGAKPHLLKQYVGKRHYLVVSLVIGRIRKTAFVHRLVAVAFLPNPDNKPQVNHKDCDKLNNNATNLEWCTHAENQAHASINGRHNNYNHLKARKLTPGLAVEIFKAPGTHKSIAAQYNIGLSTVTHIKTRRRWHAYTKDI